MPRGNLKTTIAGLFATGTLLGGGAVAKDVSTLDVAPIERVEIIAGERVEAKQIDNIVEASFPWKDQPGIKVKFDMGEPTLEEKARDVRRKQVITETVTDFDGGFKVDIILSERPDTNRFCYTIEGAESYNFEYQPPLSQQEIDEGVERAPEIEGSYAVYHKTLKHHAVGGENYASGKVMHIPRPKVWEVDSKEVTTQWAELSYDNGELCVTASQDFLDKATYPVRIDPTFGYTTQGASSVTFEGSYHYAEYNLSASALLVTVNAITSVTTTAKKATLCVMDAQQPNSSLVAGGETQESTLPVGTFVDALVLPANLSLSTNLYGFYFEGENTVGNGLIFYDAGAGDGISSSSAVTYDATCPASINNNVSKDSDRIYSMYATYCVAGSECVVNYTTPGDYVWEAPTGVTSVIAACWGGGGGGGDGSGSGGGGGGGGAFASSSVSVTAGTFYNILVGFGGTSTSLIGPGQNGGTSTFATTSVVAAPGWGGFSAAGVNGAGGVGGQAASSTGTVKFSGGNGGGGLNSGDVGGGGGGAGGPSGNGGNGATAASLQGGGGGGGNGGSDGAVTGGGASTNGGAGGNGGNAGAGADGSNHTKGGGGGGGGDDTFGGGNGGQVGAGGGGAEQNGNGSTGLGSPGRCELTYTIAAAGSDPASSASRYIRNGSLYIKNGSVYFKN